MQQTKPPVPCYSLFHSHSKESDARAQGLYSRGKDHKWKQVKDVQVLGTLGLPGGARNATDPRLLSLATAFSVQMPSDDSLRGICLPILAHHVTSLGPDVACAPHLSPDNVTVLKNQQWTCLTWLGLLLLTRHMQLGDMCPADSSRA